MEASRIRPAVAAGSFYPASPTTLEQEVDELLGEVSPSQGAAPKAVVAPHAGYVYSGTIAAHAHAALAADADVIERIIIVGPSHFVACRGLALPSMAAFATPLGEVPLDEEGRAALADLDWVRVDDRPHAREHSLEVQLPFLQRAVGSFSILPLAVGAATPAQVAAVLDRLWNGPATRVVASSDLSHYHDGETARALDGETAALIEGPGPTTLRPEQACGCHAVNGLLAVARRDGLPVRRLELANSGDTSGPRDRVVGYAPAIRVGDWVIVSGIPAAGEGSYEEKIRGMYERARQLLEASGASIADVVELTTYHLESGNAEEFRAEFERYMPIHREFFGEHRPAWTAVGTTALLSASAVVEMRVVAVAGSEASSSVVSQAGRQAPADP